ncbi:MAG: hypothetical protein BMS9Abin13_542 [Patescibacteria group bacterium]|nr:MAG: hypothetical protein BMS9Abin13_542 [Patescibacteria group bacterium]
MLFVWIVVIFCIGLVLQDIGKWGFLSDMIGYAPLNLYTTLWWFDNFMHALGGLGAAWYVLWCATFIRPALLDRENAATVLIILILAALTIGILWEIAQFLFVELRGTYEQNLDDTVADILFDIIGGFLAALFLRYR